MKKSRFALAILFLLLCSLVVSAATTTIWSSTMEGIQEKGQDFVSKLICLALAITPYVTMGLCTIAAIAYVAGAEEPGKRMMAKKMFIAALLGAVCVLALASVAPVILGPGPTTPGIVVNVNQCASGNLAGGGTMSGGTLPPIT